MQVGVNSKLLYAAVFFLLLTPIVLGSDTGALSAIPAWAPPLLALIFFAIFLIEFTVRAGCYFDEMHAFWTDKFNWIDFVPLVFDTAFYIMQAIASSAVGDSS